MPKTEAQKRAQKKYDSKDDVKERMKIRNREYQRKYYQLNREKLVARKIELYHMKKAGMTQTQEGTETETEAVQNI